MSKDAAIKFYVLQEAQNEPLKQFDADTMDVTGFFHWTGSEARSPRTAVCPFLGFICTSRPSALFS